MKSLLIVTALLMSTAAHATMAPPVVKPFPLPASSAAGGVGATAGLLGFIGALVLYDITRRWTCIGDPLRLGGPGFNEPMPAVGNVKKPPVCAGNPR